MKKILLLSILLSACIVAQALDKSQKAINEIKKNREYLYGEATMPTQEEATSLAYELLQKEIVGWLSDRASRPVESFSVKEVNRLTDTIMMRRADMYRVFAYVKKNSLIPLFYDNGIVLLDSLDIGKNEEQLRVIIENHAHTRPDTMANEAVLQQIRSKMFATPEDAPKKEEANTSSASPKREVKPVSKTEAEVIRRVRQAKNFFDLKNVLPQLKQEGLISNYGKLATANRLEQCHLIVYDAAGNIKALLGRGEETRQNLNTGIDDSLENYRGCGALWFQLK